MDSALFWIGIRDAVGVGTRFEEFCATIIAHLFGKNRCAISKSKLRFLYKHTTKDEKVSAKKRKPMRTYVVYHRSPYKIERGEEQDFVVCYKERGLRSKHLQDGPMV